MSEKVVVAVKEGKIRGIKQISKYSKAEFYSFHGIPYGQSPTGKLRYKDPVKIKRSGWNTTLDATTAKPGCIQYSLLTNEFLGNEDCLFVNIHTPKLPCENTPLKPVIVNIHPGGCFFGTPNADHYGSTEFIMHHDIVYVSIAYRLHILGFLNLGLNECSGNQGIKDIIMALEWIIDNVQSFGGDPENITLLGSSSGGALINILMLSPAAQGLFHKAIIMGLHLTNPVLPFQETNSNHAQDIAINLGYEGDPNDGKRLLSFIKKQNLQDLIREQRIVQNKLQNNMAPLLPCGLFIPSLDGGDILPKSPSKLIQSMAKIPLMVGFCDRESVMGFSRNLKKETEGHFKTSFCQNCWGWGYNLNDKDIKLINEEVESFYTKGNPVETASLSCKVDIQTDIILSDVYDSLIDPAAANSPVFVYKFSFEGALYNIKYILSSALDEPLEGTFHGTDFSYWNRLYDPRNEEAKKMVETFTKLIATFARTGNPNYENLGVEWTSSTPENPCYLSLNNPVVMKQGKLNHERSEFWHNIVKRFKN